MLIVFCKIVETRLKGYKYFEIERDFLNKLGVLIDGDFKFGVLLLVFVRFLGTDTGNLYRNVFFFFVKSQCQSPFPLSLESWHLLKVDRVFISFMFKSVNLSILQKTTKLANLLMHSQCALSEPISSSRKTRKLTVCRFI